MENTTDRWFRSILLSAIALTRRDSAIEFLIELVRSDSLHAEGAIEAILRSAPSKEVMNRLKDSADVNPRLSRALTTLINS
jgi:hypothetical protein